MGRVTGEPVGIDGEQTLVAAHDVAEVEIPVDEQSRLVVGQLVGVVQCRVDHLRAQRVAQPLRLRPDVAQPAGHLVGEGRESGGRGDGQEADDPAGRGERGGFWSGQWAEPFEQHGRPGVVVFKQPNGVPAAPGVQGRPL